MRITVDLRITVDSPIFVNHTYDIIEQQKNINTKRQTACHVKLFKNWLKENEEIRDPHLIEPLQLENYLAQFLLSVRKCINTENLNDTSRQYEPSTLLAIQTSIFRYLWDNNFKYNIKQDQQFLHTRQVLTAKMKELKQFGKGNRPKTLEAFTKDELAKLFERKLGFRHK